MELIDKITEIVEAHLPDESIFIVDIKMTGRKMMSVKITLEGDKGVSIDQCAKVSRAVGFEIEEQDLIKDAYNLEVSSAGVGEPLKLKRQYPVNVGRSVKVFLLEGEVKEREGKLEEVKEDSIVLTEQIRQKGHKKKYTYEVIEIPFSQIEKTEVQVSFK